MDILTYFDDLQKTLSNVLKKTIESKNKRFSNNK